MKLRMNEVEGIRMYDYDGWDWQNISYQTFIVVKIVMPICCCSNSSCCCSSSKEHICDSSMDLNTKDFLSYSVQDYT